MDEQEEPVKPEWVATAEESLLRHQVDAYVWQVLPCVGFYWGLALQPFWESLSHLRWAMLLFGALAGFCVVVTKIAERAPRAELHRRLDMAKRVCLAVRLLEHIVCIAYDGDGSYTFLKIVSLWFLPLSAAKESNQLGSFRVYLALHNILVLFRFMGDLQGGAPWVFGTLVVDRMLLDLVGNQQECTCLREQVGLAHAELERLAEITTKQLFRRFCDATATLTSELHIAESTPQLAAMLGLQDSSMKGRDFSALVDAEDVSRFQEHLATLQYVSEDSGVGPKNAELPESIQVTLLDAYASPVPVHVFHASFRSLDGKHRFFVGVSETWQPPKSRTRGTPTSSSRRPTGRGTASIRSPETMTSQEFDVSLGSRTLPGACAAAVRQRSFSPRPPGLSRRTTPSEMLS